MLLLLLFCAVLIHIGHGLRNVSLTVSSLKPSTEGHEYDTFQHVLEMNWQPGLDADWIGLFNISSLEELTEEKEPVTCSSPDDYPDGYYATYISFTEQKYPNGWNKGSKEKPIPGDACLPYWIAAFKYDELFQADCLKIHPTWMWDHRADLEKMPLIGLFFPGTYNSDRYNRGSITLPRKTVSRFLLTQDSDVWGELIRGIRYLDVDLGYCSYQGKSSTTAIPEDDWYLWCLENHLQSVFKDIKEFLKTAMYEIIILDFHHFPVDLEEETNLHYEVVSMLYSELSNYILPFNHLTYNSTLGEMWRSGLNVIVAYNDSETTKDFGWLWGPIPRLCGDHQTTEGLKTFLQQCLDDMSATASTPGSHHELVDIGNRNITKWFHNYWWIHANLVVTDFFLGNNITNFNVRACLDKANNIIFQVSPED